MLDRPSPRYTHAAGWTDARIERLTVLWKEGLSASQIVAELGGGLTRCAVIGKVHRLKLPKRRTIISRPPTPARKRRSNADILAQAPRQRSGDKQPTGPGVGRYDRVDRNKLKSAAIRAAAIPDEPFIDPDDGVDVTNLVGLADLNAHDCRWPSGDPLTSHFGFCGKPAVEGEPYCDEHCSRAYIGWQP
jgi:GcrA cell cycle regulator